MAAKTVWWKNGDSEHVAPNKPPKSKALDLCTDRCGQALEVHGKIGGKLVHPGDFIVVDKGKATVVRPDPFAMS